MLASLWIQQNPPTQSTEALSLQNGIFATSPAARCQYILVSCTVALLSRVFSRTIVLNKRGRLDYSALMASWHSALLAWPLPCQTLPYIDTPLNEGESENSFPSTAPPSPQVTIFPTTTVTVSKSRLIAIT